MEPEAPGSAEGNVAEEGEAVPPAELPEATEANVLGGLRGGAGEGEAVDGPGGDAEVSPADVPDAAAEGDAAAAEEAPDEPPADGAEEAQADEAAGTGDGDGDGEVVGAPADGGAEAPSDAPGAAAEAEAEAGDAPAEAPAEGGGEEAPAEEVEAGDAPAEAPAEGGEEEAPTEEAGKAPDAAGAGELAEDSKVSGGEAVEAEDAPEAGAATEPGEPPQPEAVGEAVAEAVPAAASEAAPAAEGGAPADETMRQESVGTAAIDFVILPEGYGQTKMLSLSLTVGAIRADLENELSIPENSLSMMNMTGAVEVQETLPDDKSLSALGLKPGDRVGIELRINYYQEQLAEEYVMPDSLELKVVDRHQKEKTVIVHVQRPLVEKSYLGGFRHKATGSTYHHAVTQTDKYQPRDEKSRGHFDGSGEDKSGFRFHREVQTYEYRTRSTQCKKENGTQMPKTGLFIDERTDRIIEPRRPYFSSADKAALMLEKVVIIQCHARGMFARRRSRQLLRAQNAQVQLERQEAERRQLEADLRHRREVERRMHPRTYEDFNVLYRELEAWRLNESKRIANSGFDEATRRAAQRELLHKETKLLQTIDKLKIQAHSQNRDSKVKQRLESMSKPKVWAQSDGETTTVHTPFTTRSKELMDLYSGLRLPLLTVDERLDVLLHVKWTVKEFDCNLTREIVDLIDREADLLNRGRPEKSFIGLRKRLANLFLQFIDTPEFNPEAMKFKKVSRVHANQSSTHPLSTVPIKGLSSQE